MSGAEEQNIDAVERKLIREDQVGFAVQAFVYIGNLVACVTGTVDEFDFYIRMVDEQANQFACRISCATNDSCFNNISSSLW